MNEKNNWCYTAKDPKFFIVDSVVGLFVLLSFVHLRFYTFFILFIIFFVFYLLEINKYNYKKFFKLVRNKIGGNIKKIRKNNKK